MKASLEKELAALTPTQKAEVIDFLLPEFIGSAQDDIPSDVLTELERRDDKYETDPSGALTLREFDQTRFGKK
jgi:hypothetical protein